MSVILILLTASLTIAIGFLIAFIWSVKNGQYDDDYTPSVRMLFDNDTDVNADASARDVKGLALSGPAGRKSRNEVEPVAARPGAQKNKTDLIHTKINSQYGYPATDPNQTDTKI